MAYKPPKQSIDNNDLKNIPSSEAIYEAFKDKIDQPAVSGTAGQLLQLDGYVNDPDGDPEPLTSWVNPPSGGANTTLSNLDSPTAINQVLLGQDGTAAAPAYSFTSSPNTGLFKSTAINSQPTISLSSVGSTLFAGYRNEVRLGYTDGEFTGVYSYFDFSNSGGQTYFRTRYGSTTSVIFTANNGSSANSIQTDRFLLSRSEASQSFWNMPFWGAGQSNQTSLPGSSRPWGIFARRKLGVGKQAYPNGSYNGGILTTQGETEFTLPQSFPGFVADNTANFLYYGGDENARFKNHGIGFGDKLRITKSGQPDIVRKILSVTRNVTSPANRDHIFGLDATVSAAYTGPGAVVYLQSPSFLAIDQAGNIRMEVDYSGDVFLDSAVVINDSGADKDTRIEGDTDANLVFVDASTDRVGIGTATPAEKLEINGNIKGGTISFNADANRQATITNLGFLTATKTHDFGSIAHGNEETTTITVTGAAVGDAVFVGAPSAIEANLNWCAYVSAADTVTLRLQNIQSSGNIDPASATWRITVLKT